MLHLALSVPSNSAYHERTFLAMFQINTYINLLTYTYILRKLNFTSKINNIQSVPVGHFLRSRN